MQRFLLTQRETVERANQWAKCRYGCLVNKDMIRISNMGLVVTDRFVVEFGFYIVVFPLLPRLMTRGASF